MPNSMQMSHNQLGARVRLEFPVIASVIIEDIGDGILSSLTCMKFLNIQR